MEKWIKVLILFICLFISKLDAFIYEVCVMRKCDPISETYNYFIGLGDFHDKCHKSNAMQMEKLDKIFHTCAKKDIKYIIEDISSRGFDGRLACGKFFVNSRGGILGGLAQKYIQKGFTNFQNIEYRFCRVASLSPLLNNIHNIDKKSFPSSSHIKVCCLKNEIAKVLLKIHTYDDGDILNRWYKKCITSVFKYMRFFKFDNCSQLSVEKYVHTHANDKNRLSFIKKLLVFDSALIDIEIVHAIVNAQQKNAIVIAGGSHVKNVSNIMKKLGYELLFKNNVTFRDEYDRKRCLGCNVSPGGFCRKPEPADLTVLDRFVPLFSF